MTDVFRQFLSRFTVKKLFVFWLDQWAIVFPGLVPGLVGIILRTCYFKLVAKKIHGLFFVRPFVRIEHSYGLTVGKNVHINYGTYIEARGGVTLGDNVLIGPNCTIVSFNHTLFPIENSARINGPIHLAPVIIGDNVWLGANCVVLPGITIGNNCIAAAGAVITENVPDNTIVGGVPAKVIQREKKAHETF
jgi:acetyltransferase-like isoleucine patch superfamily enzyme